MPSKTEMSVQDAINLIIQGMNKKYRPNPKLAKMVTKDLEPGESVLFQVQQSYLQNLSPTVVFATKEKLLIVRPSFWFRHLGINLMATTQADLISYDRMTEIETVNGRMLSTVVVKVLAAGDVAISGLRQADTAILVKFLEKVREDIQT